MGAYLIFEGFLYYFGSREHNVKSACVVRIWGNKGSKKVPSGHLGQEDFPSRQVTFHSHLPDVQGNWEVVFH